MTGLDLTTIDITTIWTVFSFGAALVVAVALRLVFAPENREERQQKRRMHALAPVDSRTEVEAVIRRSAPQSSRRSLPFMGDPDLLVRRAGLSIGGTAFLLICAALASALALPAVHVIGPIPGLVASLGLAFIVPTAVLRHRFRKWVAAFTQQLPDALELMMRGLRVGHPIAVTISNVGRTMPDPIGAEFRMLADQISHGDFLTDAFSDLANRIDQEDMDYLAVSIRIQHGTGGNLAEMLGTLSRVIRDRMMMRRRVRAISSEGRLSALVLSALPVGIYLTTSVASPDYYGGVADDPLFTPIVCVIVALVVANFLALRKLVSFQI